MNLEFQNWKRSYVIEFMKISIGAKDTLGSSIS